jgi:RND family efflux transporter MFP subunit
VVTQDAPRSPGIYGPAPQFARAGTYDLTLIVASPQVRDSITVRGLTVYGRESDAPREAEGGDDGISFLKEQQWKTDGFRTDFASQGRVASTFDVSGVIEPAGGGRAEVTAPVAGIIDPSGLAASPAPGQSVTRGQVLAVLTPDLEASGNAAAARARLREAEDEVARARRLVEAEAAPQRRLRDAEIRLSEARETLAGYGGPSAAGDATIRSPIEGVVVSRTVAPGRRVEAGTPLFTIVNPAVVWVVASVPAAQATLLDQGGSATFVPEGSESRFVAHRTVSLGSVIDPMSRTVTAIFEASNPTRVIRVGATARVQVQGGRAVSGVVIPRAAVLDEDGRAVAYVQAEGERFEKRELTIGAQDSERVVVLRGVKAGERVVTGAAYQVRLASLSTAVPAHGHEH